MSGTPTAGAATAATLLSIATPVRADEGAAAAAAAAARLGVWWGLLAGVLQYSMAPCHPIS
jgi:hypothetical protein